MPIERERMQKIASQYDNKNVTIGIFGSHSAKPLGMSTKEMGVKNVIIVEEGRDELYTVHNRHLYDRIIKLRKFRDILHKEIQDELRELNTIFVPNRSFVEYVGRYGIENDFEVPFYGSRALFSKCEDRNYEKGQYYLLEKAGIRFPKQFESPKEIDKLALIKVQRADNPKERCFFFANSFEDYLKEAEEYKKQGLISDEGLEKARIEEYVLGPRFNANFHRYFLTDVYGELDYVGTADRIQVNLQGFLNLPAREQLKIHELITNEEVGHQAGRTIRESKEPLFWDAAKKLVKVTDEEFPPGIRGPFGIQGSVAYSSLDKKTLEFVVYDLSLRTPGDLAIGPTSPEMRNLSLKHGINIKDPMDLVVMEIQKAAKDNRLKDIVT